ncbi:class I SAM-dependent methyltransferase [Bacillus solimangrovi]|uniref:Methyltransferase type 11 n=1 Tax=Bacillus solimangrovi TaxID=1305675 RepID=A0A1E5LIH7_9BACI|nr:class I SAM-dependent methyltransferase [Bacillus solimangrovi]OEH93890.1 methyltransferase type 11 [Bacillus solimangrovi]
MSINFHEQQNRLTYASRNADQTWVNMMKKLVDVEGKKVLDLGCGGGIYSRALASMGAASVTGVDFSEQMLISAREHSEKYHNVEFIRANALNTKLIQNEYDFILVRAVIHHIKDLNRCFLELYRLLESGGTCIIQDRTPEDCLVEGSPDHIRGYFFSEFPKLRDREITRRYSEQQVKHELHVNGFRNIKTYELWETRRTYNQLDDLLSDITNRTGRSILYELNDNELVQLSKYIKEQLEKSNVTRIMERDRWTIWKANKV